MEPAAGTQAVHHPNASLAALAAGVPAALEAMTGAELLRLAEQVHTERADIARDAQVLAHRLAQPGADSWETIVHALIDGAPDHHEAMLEEVARVVGECAMSEGSSKQVREAMLKALRARTPGDMLGGYWAGRTASEIAALTSNKFGARSVVYQAAQQGLANTPMSAPERPAPFSVGPAPPDTISALLERLADQRADLLETATRRPHTEADAAQTDGSVTALYDALPMDSSHAPIMLCDAVDTRVLRTQGDLLAALSQAIDRARAAQGTGAPAQAVNSLHLPTALDFQAARLAATASLRTSVILDAAILAAPLALHEVWPLRPARNTDVVGTAQRRAVRDEAARAALEAVHRIEQTTLVALRDAAVVYGGRLPARQAAGEQRGLVADRQEMLNIALLARHVLSFYPGRPEYHPTGLPDPTIHVESATGSSTIPLPCEQLIAKDSLRSVCAAGPDLCVSLEEAFHAAEAANIASETPVVPARVLTDAKEAIEAFRRAAQLYGEAQHAVWPDAAKPDVSGEQGAEAALDRAHALTREADRQLATARRLLTYLFQIPPDRVPADIPRIELDVRSAAGSLYIQVPDLFLPRYFEPAEAPPPARITDVGVRIGHFGPFEELKYGDAVGSAVVAVDRWFTTQGPRAHLVADLPDWIVAATGE